MIADAEYPLIITLGRGRERIRCGQARRALPSVSRFRWCSASIATCVCQRSPDASRLRSGRAFRRRRCRHRAGMRRALDPEAEGAARDAKIIHIGADPIFANYPLRGFPCDLAIIGRHRRDLAGADRGARHAREACRTPASMRAASASQLTHEKIKARVAATSREERRTPRRSIPPGSIIASTR